MPEHRKVRLTFIEKYGRDLYHAYAVHAASDRFPDYLIFDVYGEGKNQKGKKLRFITLRKMFYHNHTLHFMRQALVRFPDRAALIAHMKKHDYAFHYIPEK